MVPDSKELTTDSLKGSKQYTVHPKGHYAVSDETDLSTSASIADHVLQQDIHCPLLKNILREHEQQYILIKRS